MDMENLAEILEEELAEAFEVKNRKSLHRYVVLLTQQHVDRQSHEREVEGLRSDIGKAILTMEHGFERMDQRFEALQKQIDERFIAQQRQIDQRFAAQERRFEDMTKRFEDMNRHFDEMNDRMRGMQKFLALGFTALALIITAFNAALLLM
ncbi:MAG: hypothetical protein ACOC2B_06160 [Sediminispirochaetaceae bacterium]